MTLKLTGANARQRTPAQGAMESSRPSAVRWQVNTSNPAKEDDFRRLFRAYDMPWGGATNHDLREIIAAPEQVVAHKASQIGTDHVLVEDTSLHVEGADVGVLVRYLAKTLPALVGKRATLLTLLAYCTGKSVQIYEGRVEGTLVPPRGPAVAGFTVNPYFLPDGREHTLAEESDDAINPRSLAFAAFAAQRGGQSVPKLTKWAGPWQGDDSAPADGDAS